MPDFYVKSGGATQRANSTAYSLGSKMVPLRSDTSTNHLIAKRWVWECTTAGTSGAAVPTWPASVTQDTTTVTDGTVVWTARKPGFSSGTTANWAFAHPHLDYMLPGTAAGDRIFISSTHDESNAAALTHAIPGSFASPTLLLSVNDGAAPPTALAAGARIYSGGGAFGQTITGVAYIHGVTFEAGTSTDNASLTIGTTSNELTFESCKLRLGGNASGARINLGAAGNGPSAAVRFINTTWRFGEGTGQRFALNSVRFEAAGGGYEAGGAATDVLLATPDEAAIVRMDGCDLSGLATAGNLCQGSTNDIADYRFRNCKMPASWSGSLSPSAPAAPRARLSMQACDSGSTVSRFETRSYAGQVLSESVIKRTAGASTSWKMVSTANAEFPAIPLHSPEIYFYNTTTGAAVTLTVEVLTDNITLTDQEAWVEVMAANTASSVLGTWTSDASAALSTAASQPTSSEAWTTTGITTPVKQKLSVTFTPQVTGDFVAVVKLARASTTMYVDPAVTVA